MSTADIFLTAEHSGNASAAAAAPTTSASTNHDAVTRCVTYSNAPNTAKTVIGNR